MDALLIATKDCLGRSTQNMESFAEQLCSRSARSRVLNLGGGDATTHTAMGSMNVTVMAARAPMERAFKRRVAGTDLGGRCPTITDS